MQLYSNSYTKYKVTKMPTQVPLYATNERQWTPFHRIFLQKESKGKEYSNSICVRVWVPHGINASNVVDKTECTVVRDGFIMELKVKLPTGVEDASIYHQVYQDEIKQRIKSLDPMAEDWEQKFNVLMSASKDIDKEQEDEQAQIGEELDLYKDDW